MAQTRSTAGTTIKPTSAASSTAPTPSCVISASRVLRASLIYGQHAQKAGGTLTSGQDERCPAAVVDACQGGMNRRFRGEDNFTAWTQKRRSRKPLIPDAQPAMPTPTTPPFTIRLGGVLGKHRRIRNRF